jgi:hypothetical protein
MLTWQVDEVELEALFAPCGKITALKLGRDMNGKTRVRRAWRWGGV